MPEIGETLLHVDNISAVRGQDLLGRRWCRGEEDGCSQERGGKNPEWHEQRVAECRRLPLEHLVLLEPVQ